MTIDNFRYVDERFADLQMLRYRLNVFEKLTIDEKKYIYCLAKASLFGRDITFDQFGAYNLRIRKVLELIYTDASIDHDTEEFRQLEIYLKRLWFFNGIYHHYGCLKFVPGFSKGYFSKCLYCVDPKRLPLSDKQTVKALLEELISVIFDKDYLSKRVNKTDGEDLVKTSACHFYEGVTQQEAEDFYNTQKSSYINEPEPPSFGLNSTLVKSEDGTLYEDVWSIKGRYGKALSQIVFWFNNAKQYANSDEQKSIISSLVSYYETGDLQYFNDYCKKWVSCLDGKVDFINGFIEVYGDPLGLKGTWEGLVEYVDEEATRRTQLISDNAQWFEDNSPVESRFRKKVVKGVSAKVICAAMLGGDEYPSTAIGINLPNADWIRAEYGSKSITISNITDAYTKAAKGNGFREEFVIDSDTLSMIEHYADTLDNLHTDLHECLGHGSGQLLQGVDPDALKAYGNTIEEARADLFGLYYIADQKMVELGLVPDSEAYKAQYYTYMMNGLITQLVRIERGCNIEEAHMLNRALIAHWCLENGTAMRLVKKAGNTYLEISDYCQLRELIAKLLAEVQRIKSEGDFMAARQLVEQYAVKVDADLHDEVLHRYEKLNLAPYKGFLNPMLLPQYDARGEIVDIVPYYGESLAQQMLRYSSEYGTLI